MIVYNVNKGIDQALSKHCNFMQDNIDDELTEEYSQLANEAISFRQEVLNALGRPDDAITSIKVLQMSCAEYSAFRRNVKQLLIDSIGRDITDDEAIERIDHLSSYLVPKLKEFRDTICGYLNIHSEDTRDDMQKAVDNIYSLIRFKQCHELIVKEANQFRHDVKQLLIDRIGRDIKDDEAIAEIKRLQRQSLEADTPRPIDQIEIAKLKRELSIANKVIARLVGE